MTRSLAFDAEFVTAALQAGPPDAALVAIAGPDATLSAWTGGVTQDTRALEPGMLYVALRGARFDGHAFAQAAVDAGAAAILCEAAALEAGTVDPDALGVPCIAVKDTLAALQALAHAHALRACPIRIGLTGSNGKTTTKELLRAALDAHFGPDAVLATAGNLNNHIGLPLTAMRLRAQHEVAVFEMGMSGFGEIATLARIADPGVGVVTNMGSSHAGNLGGPAGVATAKAELFAYVGAAGGALVINADDARALQKAHAYADETKTTFGKASWADVRIVSAQERLVAAADGTTQAGLDVTFAHGSASASVVLPMLGAHNAQNAAAAVATALVVGVPFETAVAGLAHVAPAKGRLKLVAHGGVHILDDTYNANPESMRAGLSTLAALSVPGGARRIAAFGEMLELGAGAESAHKRLGAEAAKAGATAVFACGPLGEHVAQGARDAGIRDVTHAADSTALGPAVAAYVRPGDAVFVKGSRGARMENVVTALTDVSANDLLARSSSTPAQG